MLKPIIVISEIFYHNAEDVGIYERIIEDIVKYKFYKGIETPIIQKPKEQKRVNALTDNYGLSLTQWLTKNLIDNNLNICSLNPDERKKAIEHVKSCINMAAESGAGQIGMISGDDVGKEKRNEARLYLEESLSEIAEYMKQYKMGLLIETLDREQHKKQLLGPISEAVVLIKKLRKINPKCSLCWDSAHEALKEENFRETFKISKGFVSQIHLSNAILDKSDARYGDFHMMVGENGFLNIDCAREIVRDAAEEGLFNDGLTYIGMEVRTEPNGDPWETERRTREFLMAVLKNN